MVAWSTTGLPATPILVSRVETWVSVNRLSNLDFREDLIVYVL